MEEIRKLSARRIAELISSGDISAVGVLEKTLEVIKSENPKLNALLYITGEPALEQAESVDKDIKAGKALPPFAGVPIITKDNINIRGLPCTCGSKILKGYTSPYDAGVIKRIKTERLVMVGISNMDEFGMGSSNENSAFGPVKNPILPSHVPGGSSGGSAAAVASGMVPVALGSDTGGSVRQPAAYCGLVGMRPTYGLVSRFGLTAFASSMDQIGPLTRDVYDNAALLKIIAGFDKNDSTSINRDVPDYMSILENPIKGKKIGIPVEYFKEGLDPEIHKTILHCIDILKSEGVEFEEVSLPSTPVCIADYYVIANAEASSNLARYDGLKYGFSVRSFDLLESYKQTRTEGFGTEVKRRIMLGTFVLSAGYYDAYYRRAQKVRTKIRDEFIDAFTKFDLIITPTAPAPAFELGSCLDNPLQMYLNDIYTTAAPLAGIPALSMHCGTTSQRLPAGVQFMAPPLMEKLIYNAAYILEKNLNENVG